MKYYISSVLQLQTFKKCQNKCSCSFLFYSFFHCILFFTVDMELYIFVGIDVLPVCSSFYLYQNFYFSNKLPMSKRHFHPFLICFRGFLFSFSILVFKCSLIYTHYTVHFLGNLESWLCGCEVLALGFLLVLKIPQAANTNSCAGALY